MLEIKQSINKSSNKLVLLFCCLGRYNIYNFNPISDRLWYDVIRRGRAIMAQPDFLLYNSAKSGTNTQNLFPDKIFDI